MRNRLLLWILVSFAAVFLWQGFKQIGQDTHNLGVALSNLVPSRKSSTVGESSSPVSQQTEASTHIWHPAPDPTPFRGDRADFSVVSKADYDAIQPGMSYSSVSEMIGSPGEELSRTDLAGYTTIMYAWKNVNGSNMNAMFQNDRLVDKAQFGLP
jgi:Domain of Unknown Function with PDB structure (DUF3862)